MSEKLFLHTRCIPEKHLNKNNPTSQTIIDGLLCSCLNELNLKKLKKAGIEVIELRLVPYLKNDFQRLKKDILKIKKAGLKVGVFCWNQYQSNTTQLKCLEHNKNIKIASLWDKRTIRQYESNYRKLAKDFGEYIDFIYIGVYGDYGEVCFPSGVKHYKFSPVHGHAGLLCGDKCAKNLLPISTKSVKNFNNLPNNEKLIFRNWYTKSMTCFCEKVCKIVCKYFPSTRKGLPIGFADEPLEIGQIKSDIIKIGAKYNLICRWTGLGFLNDYAKSDVLSKRVSTAAHFYKTKFGTEAALKITKENALNAIYESVSNGSSLIHNDPQNIYNNTEVWNKEISSYKISKPIHSIGVYYPVESEQLKILNFDKNNIFNEYEKKLYPELKTIDDAFVSSFDNKDYAYNKLLINPIDVFITRTACLRYSIDYALFDSTMAKDGFLNTLKIVIFTISASLPRNFVKILENWIKEGGKIILRKGVTLKILETDKFYNPSVCEIYDSKLTINPYKNLYSRFNIERGFITIHEDFISVFDGNSISYRKK